MTEKGAHTIVFWVKASMAKQAYIKMLEATKDMEEEIFMSAVAPRVCRLESGILRSSTQTEAEE